MRGGAAGVLTALLALGGCGEATDPPGGGDELGFILSWPVVDSISIDPTAAPEVREIRTWGLDADSPFGVIIDATLVGDSLVAVADRVGCAIHILDIRAPDAPPRSIGGCGDGPGELRRVISVAFDGEALLVADAGHGRLHRLDATGQLLDTDRLDLAELSGSVIMSRADGVAGTLLLAPMRMPLERGQPALLVHGWGPEAVPLTPDPEIWRETTAAIGFVATGCVAAGGDVVVMANPWTPEVALVGRGPVSLGAFRTVRDWAPPTLDEGQPGAWRPGGVQPRVVCSERSAVARFALHHLADDGSQRLEVGRGHLVFLDLESRRASLMHVDGAAWPELGARLPVALHGRLLLTFQNRFGPAPTVALWEIDPW